jgi:hypothetical protein
MSQVSVRKLPNMRGMSQMSSWNLPFPERDVPGVSKEAP